MKKNFNIEKFIEVWLGEVWYDLHNDFVMTSFVHAQDKVLMAFSPLDHRLPTPPVDLLELRFSGVSLCQVDFGEWNLKPASVDTIGYKNPGDCDLSWFGKETWYSENSEMVFLMEDDSIVRINAEEVEAVPVLKPNKK